VAYFEAAAALGLPVLCNVAADEWVARKHAPLLPQADRGVVLDAIRSIAYVHLSRTSTADVLRELRPRYYAKGADWRDRLPEEELEVCRSAGIEVVFLETVTNSSTRILADYERARHGRL
jgi:bifunctional ADP-heptose synthase (sugar kinase/adenylyltransferase)